MRELEDLDSVGPATVSDLAQLHIHSVADLAKADPDELYERLCDVTGFRQNVCVRDVLHCAVAQARDPELPLEQRQWWWWTQRRKEGATRGA